MKPLEYCETHDDHYDQGSKCPHCIADRSARLARIDATARAIFVAVKAAALQPNSPYDLEDMAGYAIECYADALALERARDEAVKELDKEPR